MIYIYIYIWYIWYIYILYINILYIYIHIICMRCIHVFYIWMSPKSCGLPWARFPAAAKTPKDPVIFSGTVHYNLDPFNEFDAATLVTGIMPRRGPRCKTCKSFSEWRHGFVPRWYPKIAVILIGENPSVDMGMDIPHFGGDIDRFTMIYQLFSCKLQG